MEAESRVRQEGEFLDSCVRRRGKALLGITSRAPKSSLAWLMSFLYEEFPDVVSEVRYLPINNSNRDFWESEVRRCSAAVLYHTKHQGRLNVTDVDGALYDHHLLYLYTQLGRDKVLVVLDDMKNFDEEERLRVLQTQPSLARLSSQLILIPETQKRDMAYQKRSEFLTLLPKAVVETPRSGHTSSSHRGHPSVNSIRDPAHSEQSDGKQKGNFFFNILDLLTPSATSMNVPQQSNPKAPSPLPPCGISIFSRAAESNYQWLINSLKAEDGLRSADIRGVFITNHYRAFTEAVTKCKFAILYHTLKQGRINITDVTDSLYDKELRHLSETLGKENVIVVVDDVKSGEYNERLRILDNQPAISEYAKELFLFTEYLKSVENIKEISQIIQNLLNLRIHETRNQHMAKPSLSQISFESGSKPDLPQHGSPVDRAKGQEPLSQFSTSTSRSGSSQKTYSCPKHDAEEPKPKKIILETSEVKLKEVWVDLSERLNRNLSVSEESNEKVNNLQQTVQEMQQVLRSQEEKLKNQENNIIEAVKMMLGTVMEKVKEVEKLNEDLMRREKDLRNREAKIEKQESELQDREKNIMTQEKKLCNREENIMTRQKELCNREENIMRRERELSNMAENTSNTNEEIPRHPKWT